MRYARWTIKDIVDVIKNRINNEFDANIVFSGDRGNGKSTGASKVLFRFPAYNPYKHQVYSREKVINLLKFNQKRFCFDDEAINSGYKRDFYEKGQKDLIKILTNYRDNYNVFVSAVPNFFSLDKDLRDLVFLHIQVIRRGIAVVHTPLQNRIYSQDRWDMKNNERIERSWITRTKKDPNFKVPFHKLSTFRGYLYFNDLTPKQKAIYREVKRLGRAEVYEAENQPEGERSFYNKLYDLTIGKKLSREDINRLSLLEGKKYSVVTTTLNKMLKDNGIKETLGHFLQKSQSENNNNVKGIITDLVPDLTP